MRIINVFSGCLQQIPFCLGNKDGFMTEIRLSRRSVEVPTSPVDIGYEFTFGNKKDIFLKSSDGKPGLLLRIDTFGISGQNRIVHLGGRAKKLSFGAWKNSLGEGPDELWHVEWPAIFKVEATEQEYFILVLSEEKVCNVARDQFEKMVNDNDGGEIAEMIRYFSKVLPKSLQVESNVPTRYIASDLSFNSTWKEIIESEQVGGVSLSVGPGGGAQFSFDDPCLKGVRIVKRHQVSESKMILECEIQCSQWQLSWREYRGLKLSSLCIADSGGIHRLWVDGCDGDEISSDEWAGLPLVSPSISEFTKLFASSK
jgi:hypothetical protein